MSRSVAIAPSLGSRSAISDHFITPVYAGGPTLLAFALITPVQLSPQNAGQNWAKLTILRRAG